MLLTPEQKAKIRKEMERRGLAYGFSARAAGMRAEPATFDEKTRSVRFVATVERPVMVFDWERWDFVNEILVSDGMILPDGDHVRLLDTHSRYSVSDVLGSASDFQDCEVDDIPGKDCRVEFSSVQEGQDAATKVREGHITDVSVGYRVIESYWVPEGEKQIINGKSYEGPVKVSTRWELRELSLVPIGADNLAKVRSLMSGPGADEGRQQHNGGNTMHKCPDCGKDFDGRHCTACGHRADQAPDKNTRGAQGAAAPAPAAGDKGRGDGSTGLTPEQVRAQIDEAQRTERERVNGINDAVSVAGLDAEFSRTLVDQGVSLDQARAKIFEKLKERGPAVGAGIGMSIEIGTEAVEKFRAAAIDGFALRGGLRVEKPADGSNIFRGMSLLDLARESLENAGIRTRGMDKRIIAARALSPASSSDFPAIMGAVTGRHLLGAYAEAPSTWRPFVAIVDAPDFKDMYGIKLSESPDLLDLDQNGEYKTAKFSDSQEKYRVVTKGRKVKLTRTMIINDDLRAFTRIPKLFGFAARRFESDAVYSLITSNPVMSDNKTLFHADHKNIVTATAFGSAGLSKGRTLMRKQKGMNGSVLDLTPAFLLHPVELETDAEILLRSAALPDDNKSAGVHNPWAGKLTPIADTRLDDNSITAYYLLAHPNQAAAIEVAYLMGDEQPFIDDEVEFASDSLVVKVRHDFGAGLVDYAGINKNAGA
ncbi:MAG: Mu-like prophage major head subunit gpT family protein [Desulfobulbaceae bacterium]|nr:Mu-like prophage major head subunit gpT family protein [Desulfobulbaceae bacterium]